MDKSKLLAELKSLDEQISALLAKDELTDEQLAEHDALVEKREKTAKKIELVKAQEARQAEREQAEAEAQAQVVRLAEAAAREAQRSNRRTQPNATTEIGNPRLAAEDDPKKGFKTPREFMMTVMEAGRGKKLDERLNILKQAAAGSDEAGTFSDPYGGFLVPEGFSPELLQLTPEGDPMAGRTRQVPMTNPIVKFPARVDKNHSTSVSGGLRVFRRAEADSSPSSRMELEQVSLEAHNLFGLSYATEEILTDSPISFVAILASGFQDEFNSRIIDERLNGTGVGEYLGVLNSPALITVAKENSQTADTVVYENVIKMRARCWGYSDAIWLANHDVLPQLMLMNQTIGDGGLPVWQPSAREDHPDILLGRPLFFTEYCQTVGDVGDLVLANFREYLEGTLQPLQSAESMHVRFVNHERAFKFWLRNAGAPWWRSPLTPKNSAATLSPFVTLAERGE